MSKRKEACTLFSFGVVKKRKIEDEHTEDNKPITNSSATVSSEHDETASVISAPSPPVDGPFSISFSSTNDLICSEVDIGQEMKSMETLSDNKRFSCLRNHYLPTSQDLKLYRQEFKSGSRKGSFCISKILADGLSMACV